MNKKLILTYNIFLSILIAGFSVISFASELRHQITDDSTPESMQTNNACKGFWSTNKVNYCIPMNFAPAKPGRISLDFMLKANGHAFNILRKVYEEEIDQTFVDDLFKENSFEDGSGSAQVQAIYKNTRFSYMPVHFLGGYKLINPSLPEVHLAAVQGSALRISQILETDGWFLGNYYALYFAPTLVHYSRKFYAVDAEVFTMIGKNPRDIISKKRKSGIDGELSFGLLTKSIFLPSLFFAGKNLAQNSPCIDCERPVVDIEPYYQSQVSLHAAWQWPHPIGESILAFGLPFTGYFKQIDDWNSAISYIYQLSQIGMYVTFSPLKYSFGFLLNSQSYKIGIMYTEEKQENSLMIEREKETYVFTSINL